MPETEIPPAMRVDYYLRSVIARRGVGLETLRNVRGNIFIAFFYEPISFY